MPLGVTTDFQGECCHLCFSHHLTEPLWGGTWHRLNWAGSVPLFSVLASHSGPPAILIFLVPGHLCPNPHHPFPGQSVSPAYAHISLPGPHLLLDVNLLLLPGLTNGLLSTCFQVSKAFLPNQWWRVCKQWEIWKCFMNLQMVFFIFLLR